MDLLTDVLTSTIKKQEIAAIFPNLTGIKENRGLCVLPDGTRVHKMTLASNPTSPRRELGGRTFFDVTGGRYKFMEYVKAAGATIIPGFQLRYVYLIDKAKQKDLTVPVIPFSKIDEVGAGMYKGEKVTLAARHIDAPEPEINNNLP